MSETPHQSMFSQIDVTNVVSPTTPDGNNFREEERHAEEMSLLRQMALQMKRQNELLTQMINLQTAAQRQRTHELQMWRSAHPELAQGCRKLLEKMSEMQTDYFTRMVDESGENCEDWGYSEYMFNDFIDRFGPRLMHLNGLLQALSQLAAPMDGSESTPGKP